MGPLFAYDVSRALEMGSAVNRGARRWKESLRSDSIFPREMSAQGTRHDHQSLYPTGQRQPSSTPIAHRFAYSTESGADKEGQ